MRLAEIVKELKANDRADWPFARRSACSSGFWTINSDEIFQFSEIGEDTKELAFSVDDVTANDWYIISRVSGEEDVAIFDRAIAAAQGRLEADQPDPSA